MGKLEFDDEGSRLVESEKGDRQIILLPSHGLERKHEQE